VARSITDIGRVAGDRIEEVWLHGQFHAVNRVIGVQREMAGWLGDFTPEGHLNVAAMIGQPPWLVETLASSV
jgi:hypothetical protein